jgi:hypothetical protein
VDYLQRAQKFKSVTLQAFFSRLCIKKDEVFIQSCKVELCFPQCSELENELGSYKTYKEGQCASFISMDHNSLEMTQSTAAVASCLRLGSPADALSHGALDARVKYRNQDR